MRNKKGNQGHNLECQQEPHAELPARSLFLCRPPQIRLKQPARCSQIENLFNPTLILRPSRLGINRFC
ncbi:MAG: hypothetical protein ACFFCW_34410, partial [Candidatus Hodarchaeota archaeon]